MTDQTSGSLLRLANPAVFNRLADRLIGPFAVLTALLFVWGLYVRSLSPRRITSRAKRSASCSFHVPSAWMAMFVYAGMSLSALGTLIWRHPMADVAQKCAAPLGAGFTLLCLVTGSLWGKPMWVPGGNGMRG